MKILLILLVVLFFSCDYDDDCNSENVGDTMTRNGRILYCNCDGEWSVEKPPENCDDTTVVINLGYPEQE